MTKKILTMWKKKLAIINYKKMSCQDNTRKKKKKKLSFLTIRKS